MHCLSHRTACIIEAHRGASERLTRELGQDSQRTRGGDSQGNLGRTRRGPWGELTRELGRESQGSLRETDAGAWERLTGELGRDSQGSLGGRSWRNPPPKAWEKICTIRTCFSPHGEKYVLFGRVFPKWEKYVLFGRVFPKWGKICTIRTCFPRPLPAKFAPQAWSAPSLRPQTYQAFPKLSGCRRLHPPPGGLGLSAREPLK